MLTLAPALALSLHAIFAKPQIIPAAASPSQVMPLNHQTGTISGVAAVYQRHEFMKESREALELGGNTFID